MTILYDTYTENEHSHPLITDLIALCSSELLPVSSEWMRLTLLEHQVIKELRKWVGS